MCPMEGGPDVNRGNLIAGKSLPGKASSVRLRLKIGMVGGAVRYLISLDQTQVVKGAIWFVAIAMFFFLRWQPDPEAIFNMDETIAPAVSEAMLDLGYLDPNWYLTNLPDHFRYDQYNFYLYMILAHFSIISGSIFGFEAVHSARIFNIFMQIASIPLIYFSIKNLTGSVVCGFFGIFVFITAPTIVLDATIVRPESLLYFLSAALVFVSTSGMGKLKTIVLWGIIFALGVAVKITFISLAPIAVAAYIIRFWSDIKNGAIDALMAFAIFVISLFIIAPFMFINFEVTLNGIRYLQNQYDGLHPPHSLLAGGVLEYFFYNLHFFIIVIPSIFALSAIGLAYGDTKERIWIISLISTFVILLLYFSTKTVFFERNYSHAIIPAIAAASIGFLVLRRKAALPVSLIVLACLLFVPYNMSVAVLQGVHHRNDDLTQFQNARGLSGYARITEAYSLRNKPLPPCGAFVFADFNDDFSRLYVGSVSASGYNIDAIYHSRFRVLPTSTFHTNVESSHIFVSKSCD